jgi:hypothetical protein
MLKLIVALEAVAIAMLLIVGIRVETQSERVFRAAASAANSAYEIENHFDSSGEVGCR